MSETSGKKTVSKKPSGALEAMKATATSGKKTQAKKPETKPTTKSKAKSLESLKKPSIKEMVLGNLSKKPSLKPVTPEVETTKVVEPTTPPWEEDGPVYQQEQKPSGAVIGSSASFVENKPSPTQKVVGSSKSNASDSNIDIFGVLGTGFLKFKK